MRSYFRKTETNSEHTLHLELFKKCIIFPKIKRVDGKKAMASLQLLTSSLLPRARLNAQILFPFPFEHLVEVKILIAMHATEVEISTSKVRNKRFLPTTLNLQVLFLAST